MGTKAIIVLWLAGAFCTANSERAAPFVSSLESGNVGLGWVIETGAMFRE